MLLNMVSLDINLLNTSLSGCGRTGCHPLCLCRLQGFHIVVIEAHKKVYKGTLARAGGAGYSTMMRSVG